MSGATQLNARRKLKARPDGPCFNPLILPAVKPHARPWRAFRVCSPPARPRNKNQGVLATRAHKKSHDNARLEHGAYNSGKPIVRFK